MAIRFVRRFVVVSFVILKTIYWFFKSKYYSHYHFKLSDLFLFLRERFWKTPTLKILEVDERFDRILIKDKVFFWPDSLNKTGLEWLFNEVYYPFDKNPSSYSHPNTCIPLGGWVIDAGACEGFFTMLALERGAAKVLAVEPIPILFESLTATFNLEQNRINNFQSVNIIQFALSDNLGSIKMSNNLSEPWNSCVPDVGDGLNEVSVPMTTIDNLVKSYGFSENGLIKMDIEGSEMLALAGATETLLRFKPKLAIAVYHELNNAEKCKDIILKANPSYKIEFRGMYLWRMPACPYLLFAY